MSAAALLVVVALSSPVLPPFSWDTVQTYVHCANASGPWNSLALERLTAPGVGFVVFEKTHGLFADPVNTSAETKIAAACAQVKTAAAAAAGTGRRSPRGRPPPDCYQYVEVDWARTYYSLGHYVDAHTDTLAMHWSSNGSLFAAASATNCPDVAGCKGNAWHYPFHAYDFRSPEMQQRWVARITGAIKTGHVDGAFVDGNRGGWGFGSIRACNNKTDRACATHLSAGLAQAHRIAAAAIGPTMTLISNYPTPEALKVANGGMCERCGHGVKTVLQLQKQYAHNRCGLHNGSCVLQYRPFGTGHQVPPYTALANQSIATFLLAAGPYSYYGAGSESGIGPDACLGVGGSMRIPTWPDMSRPLGAPQGDFKNSSALGGWMLTRVFGSGGAAVTRVALNDSFSCIWWADGFVTGRRCPPHNSAMTFSIFGDWGNTKIDDATAAGSAR
eukprot:COSAG01_NODE_551_length_15579_cov_30.915181_2_plen_445_part_00